MRKLTPDERAAREAARAEATQAANRARWGKQLDDVHTRIDEAGTKLKEALAAKTLTLRDIWLVLGVFETEEKTAQAGKHESCKTKWFDRIAPRAKPDVYPYYGVSSYSVKTAEKAALFLKGSHNGYVYLTDLGYAAALWLRQTFRSLDPAQGIPPGRAGLPMGELGDLPYPRWRQWAD
jgi:hypothetical protein